MSQVHKKGAIFLHARSTSSTFKTMSLIFQKIWAVKLYFEDFANVSPITQWQLYLWPYQRWPCLLNFWLPMRPWAGAHIWARGCPCPSGVGSSTGPGPRGLGLSSAPMGEPGRALFTTLLEGRSWTFSFWAGVGGPCRALSWTSRGDGGWLLGALGGSPLDGSCLYVGLV